jgi:hypothetical protein
MVVRRVVAAVLTVGLSLGPVAELCAQPQETQAAPQRPPAQKPPAEAPPDDAAGVDVDELPISVDRIGKRLSKTSPISLELSQPMFRTEVIETRPKWLGDIEWLPEHDPKLPVPSGPASHREFLTMVTPQQVRPFGHVKNLDLLELVAASFAQGVATSMLAGTIKRAVERRRAASARAEVDAAIEAWKQEREQTARPVPPPPPTTDPPTTAPPR